MSRTEVQLQQDLASCNLEAFVKTINLHFARIPYYVFKHAKEGFYQAGFFTLLEKSGIKTQAEVPTNIGRIDLVAHMPQTTVIFELKVDQTAASAFDQMQVKKYSEQYAQAGKEILVIGLNFSSKSRNITDWKGSLYAPGGVLIKEL